MSDWSEFNFGREGIGPSAMGQYISDLGGMFGDAFTRGNEGRSIVGYFGSAIAGGAMGGGGEEGGASAGTEGLGQFGSRAGGYLGGLGSLWSGGGGGQQQPQGGFYTNPFSPRQPIPPDSPYHPMQFQNESFRPWQANVAATGIGQKPALMFPQQHIFAPGQGLF